MRRNAGLMGIKKSISRSESTGIFDTFDCFIYRKFDFWPRSSEFAITPSTTNVSEGSTMTFTVTDDQGLVSGTFYWTITTGGGVSAADFVQGLSGSFTMTAGSGVISITPVANDGSESETFTLEVRSGSVSGDVLVTSGTITITDVSGYTLTAGTKAPTLGSGGASWTPSGWTSRQNGSADDANLSVTIPTFTINSTDYTAAFVGSNTYITFASGSNAFSSLSASNPALNKIHLGAADNSYQRVATISSGTDYTRIRYEGTAATSGTAGSPNIVYEATFFDKSLTGSVPVVEVLFANHSRTSGQAGIASASTYYATYSQSANQSYVFVGNATGTSWTIYTAHFMDGTGY
jgi:hypothetical protein